MFQLCGGYKTGLLCTTLACLFIQLRFSSGSNIISRQVKFKAGLKHLKHVIIINIISAIFITFGGMSLSVAETIATALVSIRLDYNNFLHNIAASRIFWQG